MIKHFQFMVLCLSVLLAGCSNQSAKTMQSLQSKNNEEVNYSSGDISIKMDAKHSLIRLAEYTSDTQANPYPKTTVNLRTHDVLYMPYQIEKENVKNNVRKNMI